MRGGRSGPPRSPLPIDPVLTRIVEAVRATRRLVLEAPPGAGKTTRVPPALLDAGIAGDREVVVLQPRRLAARMAARRVAEERGERLGETVGFQVRFEDVSGPRTRLRYVTEGILSRRLLSDPTLARVGCVVLDEFHERHLASDVALATLRRLQDGPRPDLALVVMSATLDAEPVAAFLGGCERIRSEGRAFPVEVAHLDRRDDRPLEAQVAAAVARVVAETPDGDVLVFLPGAAEIRRAADACRPLAARAGLLVLPLHGDLPADEQDRAVSPADRRKVVLSTNVAETSVTIDGVVAVVDSGLARVASHAPWSGLPVLRTQPISRASAAQRAGRAGRTRPGRCLRLYTKPDHDARPAFDVPEVSRLDLAETVLELRAAGVDPAAFPWFQAPAASALAAADALLRRLSAVESGKSGSDPILPLSARGRRMLRLPLHPRLARLLVEAEDRGVLDDGATVAALLSERDLVRSRRGAGLSGRGGKGGSGGGGGGAAGDAGRSDVVARLDAFEEACARRFDPAARAVDRVRGQILRILDRGPRPPSPKDPEAAIALCVLAAFPDRVARRRRPGEPEVILCGGGSATLATESVVRDAEFLVAVDAEERPRGGPLVRIASAVDPEQLVEERPDDVREETVARWDAAAERVDALRRTCYEDLVLEESRVAADGAPEVERVLCAEAAKAGARSFVEPAALDRLLARTAFAAEHAPASGLRALSEEDVRATLSALCAGKTSFRELREADLLGALVAALSPAARAALAAAAPEHVRLPGGWSPRVEYAAGRAPFLEAQLQDFFGQRAGPTIAGGKVAVTLHLLGPNRRPVQVTTDLAGFWSRHYPDVRRELSRRYPRHEWPSDPLAASPPERRGKPRRA